MNKEKLKEKFDKVADTSRFGFEADKEEIWDFFSKEIDSMLDGLKMKPLDLEDIYYGKSEVEHGFEHAYNQAVKEFNYKLDSLKVKEELPSKKGSKYDK